MDASSGSAAAIHLTQEQAALLVTDLQVPEERRVRYTLAFLLGLRDGELAALAWANVKLEAGVPHLDIKRALVTRNASGIVRFFRSKALNRRRQLALTPLAFAVLERWREHGWSVWVGREPEEYDPVFPDCRGGWARPPSTYLQADLAAAGLATAYLGRSIDFHATRRAFATWLDAAGVSKAVVRRLMGLESNALSPRLRRGENLGSQLRALESIVLGIQASEVVATRQAAPHSPPPDATHPPHSPPLSQNELTPLQSVRRLLDELEQKMPSLAHDVDSTGLAWEVEMVSQNISRARSYLRGVEAFEQPLHPSPARDVHGRQNPQFVVDKLSHDCPRHVWSIHVVPGRPAGPPLAVRRRVLNLLDSEILLVELGQQQVHVRSERLRGNGRDRSLGQQRRDGGLEPVVWFYSYCPTNEEREQWVERRRREVALLSQRELTFWVNVANPLQDAPDVAVACSGERLMHLEDKSGEWNGRRDVGVTWNESGEEQWSPVDLFDLLDAQEGLPRLYQQDHQRVFLERPTPGQLAALGQQRAVRRREAEDHKRRLAEERAAEARRVQEERDARYQRFQEELERKVREWETRQCAQRNTRPISGDEALRELGFTRESSEEDVRRAYRKRVAAERPHPEQGGSHEAMVWLNRVKDAACAAVRQ